MAVTTPKTFKVKVAMTLIKSQNVYKGPFETVDMLDSVQALNGDYADVYETGTRWQYKADKWVNTGDKIPVDSQYAQVKNVSVLAEANTIVQRDDSGHVYVESPEALQQAANKQYVDTVDEVLQQSISDEHDARVNADNALTTSLNAEIARAEGKEAALETSIQGLDDDITAENVRAEAAEEELQTNINKVESDLSAEVTRAKNVENANAQAIDAEKIRAATAENKLTQDLNTEVTARTTQTTNLTKAINDETSRAQTAEEALSEEVATKLAIVNSAGNVRAYTIGSDGAQTTTEIAENAVANSIAKRHAGGALTVAAPIVDTDAATKKYVDDVDVVHQGQLQTLENELADETDRAKTAEGVLADSIDEETKRAKQAEAANNEAIVDNASKVAAINAKIPNAASADNKLADIAFVNSSIANNASNFVTPSASGDTQWSSLAALNAGPWFLMGKTYIPTKNDYAVYLADDRSVWRAVYDGQYWVTAYKVNDTPFTQAQQNALNSGVTAELLATMATEIAAKVVKSALQLVLYGTDSEGNQTTIAQDAFATAAQGTKADTAYQKPATGIPQADLASAVQSALELARTALQSYTETDPTVPEWAKQPNPPTYTKADIGLGNVDNTSDMNKPVSTAQKAAIDAVADEVALVDGSLDEHIANKSNPHDVTAEQTGAEPAFTKNTAFNKAFGTTADTVCEGNDSRLSNSRTPTSHASSATTYGEGTNVNYGHVRLSSPMTAATSQASGTNDSRCAEGYRYISQTSVNLNYFTEEGHFTLYNVTTRTNFPTEVTVPSTPAYYLEVKRMYSASAVVQVLYVRGTTEVWIRYSTSATSWGAWTRLGGAASPYVVNLSTSSWSGSSSPYTYSIMAVGHGKGVYPQVRTFVNNEETYDSPMINASGDITLYSNTKIAMRVVIY